MLASRGEMTPPCGVPCSVGLSFPWNTKPAFNHPLMSSRLGKLYLFHKIVLQLVGIVFVSQIPNIKKKNVSRGFGLKFGKQQKSCKLL
jgi:hypothetical protein